MSPALRLAAIAGGRRDLLTQSPGDIGKYAAMGGVILTTSCVAAASGAVAVNMALRLTSSWSVLVGLLWGVVIFNLDRLMVTQMVRQTDRRMLVWLAIPRMALALILGFVISTPLVLKIFEVEIGSELETMHRGMIADYQTQLDSTPPFNQIPQLEKAVSDAQVVLATGVTLAVDEDPDVKAAQDRYDRAEEAFIAAEAAVVCEKEGTCGSGRAGAGIAYDEKVGIRDDARQRRDEARSALDAIRARVSTAQGTANGAKQADARQTIEASVRRLDELRPQRTAAADAYTELVNQDAGLLAGLEALNGLTDERTTLRLAHWTLFLLFLAIELMPVMFKLLQIIGPMTTYESLAAREDATTRLMHKQAAAQRLRHHHSQLGVAGSLEKDRARRAKVAGVEHNRKLVTTQSAVISEALQAWSEFAHAEAADALARWRRRAASPTVANPPHDPGPTAKRHLGQDRTAPVGTADDGRNATAQIQTGNGYDGQTVDPRQDAHGAAVPDLSESQMIDIAQAARWEPADRAPPVPAPLAKSRQHPSALPVNAEHSPPPLLNDKHPSLDKADHQAEVTRTEP